MYCICINLLGWTSENFIFWELVKTNIDLPRQLQVMNKQIIKKTNGVVPLDNNVVRFMFGNLMEQFTSTTDNLLTTSMAAFRIPATFHCHVSLDLCTLQNVS